MSVHMGESARANQDRIRTIRPKFVREHEGAFTSVLLFIVNEQSGNGRGRRAWATVERYLREQTPGIRYAKIAAATEQEAVREATAQTATGRVTALVAIGGDGTAHALLPLAASARLPLGIIPCGSGNDIARAFKLPRDPIAALQVILNGATRKVDLLATHAEDAHPPNAATPQLTLTCVAAGLDGEVARNVNRSRYKRWCNRLGIGSAAYIIGLLYTLIKYKPGKFTVIIDGIQYEFRHGWMAAIANLPSYGGGLRICPDASPTDGRLHACIVHSCNALQLLLVFPTVLFGRHVRSRFVTMLSGAEISVRAAMPVAGYGDGEPVGCAPLHTTVLPDQLLLLTSSSG